LVNNFLDDQWHSYHKLLSEDNSFLEREFVFDWFGDRSAFMEFHNSKQLEKDFKEIYIE